MIGTQGATFLTLLLLFMIGFWAVAAGALMCLVRRRRWGLTDVLLDAALAEAVAILLFLLATVVEGLLNAYEPIKTPVFVIAVACVVVRHVMPRRAARTKPPVR